MATLLAEVVELTGDRAVFPGRWAQVAKLAMEHDSVRRALLAEEDSRSDSTYGRVWQKAREQARLLA